MKTALEKYLRGMNPNSRNGFKKDHPFYPGTPILVKGHIPWNKGKENFKIKGRKHPMWGKKHKKETRIKMSESRKGRFRGINHPRWKGGKWKKQSGYIALWKPKHPYANPYGYVYEHRLVVEEKIGRYLKPIERTHHLDGDKTNNRLENLVLCDSQSSHSLLHQEMEKFVFKLIQEKKVYYDKDDKKFILI